MDPRRVSSGAESEDTSRSIIAYEKDESPFIKELSAQRDLLTALADVDILLLLPQSVSLQDIAISSYLLLAHIVMVDVQDSTRFFALDGSRGIMKECGDATLLANIVIPPPTPIEWKSLHENPIGLFGPDVISLFQRTAEITIDSAPIIFFRGRISIDGLNRPIPVAVISAPLPHTLNPVYKLPYSFKEVLNVYQRYAKVVSPYISSPVTQGRTPMSPESSQAPTALGYRAFMQKLKKELHPKDEIRLAIRRFAEDFMNTHSDEDGERLSQFIDDVQSRLLVHPAWKGSSPEEVNSIGEGLERYITSAIYEKAFPPNGKADTDRDAEFYERTQRLSFLKLSHLEIPESFGQEVETMASARGELLRVDKFRAPKDKLVCLLNCCKLVAKMIFNNSGLANADEFLPLLIWVVLTSKPTNLPSNIAYVLRFRNPTKILSETAYYLTNFEMAITFIENMDSAHVKMDAEEFQRRLRGESLPATPTSKHSLHHGDQSAESPSKEHQSPTGSSTSNTGIVRTKSADQLESAADDFDANKQSEQEVLQSSELQRMSALFAKTPSGSWMQRKHSADADQIRRLALEMTSLTATQGSAYRYEQVTLETLKMGDIPALLEEYKLLLNENRRLHSRIQALEQNQQQNES